MPPARGRSTYKTPVKTSVRAARASTAASAARASTTKKKSIARKKQSTVHSTGTLFKRKKMGIPFLTEGEWRSLSVPTPPKDIQYLCLFNIEDSAFTEFRRFVLSPMDCVINIFQLLGMLDPYTANVLRISYVGFTTGFNEKQIEGIFTLYGGYKYKKSYRYKFHKKRNFEEFRKELEKLQPNQGVWANLIFIYEGEIYRHAIFIVKDTTEHLFVIDPQIKNEKDRICELGTYLENYIRDKDGNLKVSEYRLLYRNNKKLNNEELIEMGFTGLLPTQSFKLALPTIVE